jgi:hypothetical protein
MENKSNNKKYFTVALGNSTEDVHNLGIEMLISKLSEGYKILSDSRNVYILEYIDEDKNVSSLLDVNSLDEVRKLFKNDIVSSLAGGLYKSILLASQAHEEKYGEQLKVKDVKNIFNSILGI